MEKPLDPTEWPRYIFHFRETPALVHTPEEEAEMGAGWKRVPYTDEEAREARRPPPKLDATTYPSRLVQVDEDEEPEPEPEPEPSRRFRPRTSATSTAARRIRPRGRP